MAKKKRRLKKRINYHRQVKAVNPSTKDKHHLFYFRRNYMNGARGELRRYWYSACYIPRNTLHKLIHKAVNSVPSPKDINAKSALAQLKLLEEYGVLHETDNIQRRLEVMIGLFDCIEQPTADALKKQLEIVNRFYNPP